MAAVDGYTSLQAAVSDWIARGNLAGFVPNFIQNCEERFYRQPRNWGRWMESALDATIASSVIPVPSDWLGLKYAYVYGNPSSRMDWVSLNHLYGRYPRGSGTGVPEWMSRDVGNFVFGPAPDSNYTIKGVYYAKPVLLRNDPSDAASHWLIVNAPDILIYGALLEAEPFMKNDARLPVWQQMFDRAIADYRDQIRDEDGHLIQDVLA